MRVWRKGNCKSRYIVVDKPCVAEIINSPLRVQGRARGTWFFEGDFPLLLEDEKGRIIAKGYCTARGEWMTEDFVPFAGTLTFRKPEALEKGKLIFKKDNPTDRPEFDDALEIPIYFH